MLALDQSNPWFWIVSVVGAVAIGAVCRWLWHAVIASLKEVLREPVAEAKETAQLAADHAVELKETIGTKNGNGDLVTMVERSLANQYEMFAWQRAKDKADEATRQWQLEHDELDAQTRADVTLIKQHLDL